MSQAAEGKPDFYLCMRDRQSIKVTPGSQFLPWTFWHPKVLCSELFRAEMLQPALSLSISLKLLVEAHLPLLRPGCEQDVFNMPSPSYLKNAASLHFWSWVKFNSKIKKKHRNLMILVESIYIILSNNITY